MANKHRAMKTYSV